MEHWILVCYSIATEFSVCFWAVSRTIFYPDGTGRKTGVSRHPWNQMNNRSIAVPGAEVAIATRHEQGYISLTDMVKSFEGGSALIEQWLRNKDTELFLGVWEQINNPAFNSLEFEGIRNEAGRNSSYLSAKKCVEATGAIGLHAEAGR
jgi:hypothetical protein